MSPRLFHVCAFTKEPFAGNSAGVVLDADELTAVEMQALARELRHSETAFVMRSDDPDCDVKVRYFTPTVEVPICGHATIAAHYARATALGLGDSLIHQRSIAGRHAVRVHALAGDYRISMEQGPVSFGGPLPSAIEEAIADALGLNPCDRDLNLPMEVVSTGHSKIMVPLTPTADLDAIEPDLDALTEISRKIGCHGFFPFAVRPHSQETDGRMFAPAIGIPEDPVTGNANGPMGAYIVRYGVMEHDGHTLRLRGHQGRRMGRPGVVDVRVSIDHGLPALVEITGDACIVSSTDLAAEGWPSPTQHRPTLSYP